MSIYQLRQDADGIVLVYQAGNQVIKLEGGSSELIVMTFLNMQGYGEQRADDYMAGVVAGIIHMNLLRPDAFGFLPSVPPLPPQDEPPA